MSRLYEKLQQEKETILTTANRHHATNVRLFGSVVRGEENDASDIDFPIVVKGVVALSTFFSAPRQFFKDHETLNFSYFIVRGF